VTLRLFPPIAAPRFPALILAALTLAAPASAQQAPDALSGCIPCHGPDGVSRDADIPHLAGQSEGYLFNQLRAFRDGRRPHKEMRYMSRNMTDDDMRALAAYFSSLPPR
jgi:cytochrome c553